MIRQPFLVALAFALSVRPAAAEDFDFFEKRIRPVLVEHCYSCHSAMGKQRGGLRLDGRESTLVGGDSGPALAPGNKNSLLLKAVRYADETMRMPPKGKLPAAVIADLEKWVAMGAPDPRTETKKEDKKPDIVAVDHWSFRPLQTPAVPAVKDPKSAAGDIDRFIRAELDKKGLKPGKPATSLQLLRRVTFDLTGLPPTAEQLAEFETAWKADPNGAFEKLVDRLLGSKEYAERWARHWLDVARFADSTGGGANWVMDDAWRYRDWVISAFERDLPFDQFIIEQIAGDLIPGKTGDERLASIVATGFLMIGPKELAEYDVEKLRMEIVDEQIDTMGRAFLGLTIGCARCHDHKFDPILTREYYALAGIFRSTTALGPDKAGPISQVLRRNLPTPPEQAKQGQLAMDALKKLQPELTKQQAELKKLRGIPTTDPKKLQEFSARVKTLDDEAGKLREKVNALVPRAVAVIDDAKPADLPVFIRGDLNNRGPNAPRGFLQTAFKIDAAQVNAKQSGRLELAKWVASPDNPLTSRVFVNRVWHWLLGTGLVATVDNFGLRGDTPTHPELLDHLADRFVREGWSMKKLIREIVLSQTYRLGSGHDPVSIKVDPENRLLWRHERRRLEAEEIRDAVLFISGDLDPTRGGSTNVNTGRLGFEALQQKVSGDPRRRRSVYLPVYRGGFVPDLFQVFDFPDSGLITGRRNVTTVASQALYLMNSDFIHDQAEIAAAKMLKAGSGDFERLQAWYRATFNRNPSDSEARRAEAFLQDYRTAWASRGTTGGATPDQAAWTALCHAMFASNEFLFVE